jgi:hormone-sensitive lipase
MHGGGFIALSSRSTQSYTRKWADELKVPIFSVDYRMPPNHTFPTASNDCLVVYEFLLNHVHKFMNIKPTNIYITGDSAGGNLTCSLTGLILKKKLAIPRGLYIAYPAVDLRLTFSKSKIYSLTDVLLWPSMLLLCLNSYLANDFKQAENPIASPILMNE